MKKTYENRIMKGLIPGIIALAASYAATAQVGPGDVKQANPHPHFSHQTIFVVDLAKASAFYENVLELPKIPEPFHDNRHTWFKISEHGQLHVVSGAAADIAHDINIHLAFSVPSLPEFMKHLDALHIKYGNWAGKKEAQVRPDKVSQIYLQDPDGYWIEVNDDHS